MKKCKIYLKNEILSEAEASIVENVCAQKILCLYVWMNLQKKAFMFKHVLKFNLNPVFLKLFLQSNRKKCIRTALNDSITFLLITGQ